MFDQDENFPKSVCMAEGLQLQAQRFETIEGFLQLLGQQMVDANNQAAAQRAAILCGIERGSASSTRSSPR